MPPFSLCEVREGTFAITHLFPTELWSRIECASAHLRAAQVR
jgi:hypothetical protein